MTTNRAANRETENKPHRVPVGGVRDILSVYGKDPAQEYRFVKDTDEGGLRIQTFKRGGYEFTQGGTNSDIKIGEECVYKSKKSNGSIIRYPCGADEHGRPQFLFLMQIKKEWYEEDQAAKMADVDAMEDTITGKKSSEDNELGQYGSVRVEHNAD